MEKAIELKSAIQIVVKARAANHEVTAIWCKLDRVASYLNKQLADELTGWGA